MSPLAPADVYQGDRDWPADLFTRRVGRVELESDRGHTIALDCTRWHGHLERADRAVLARCRGPVLDVGCGPGRHVTALADRGMQALGIDTSLAAVATAQARGAPAVHMSVFGPVPKRGWWATVLLLDGNVGIGGDVARLLGRVRELLRPGGQVLIETASPLARSEETWVRVRHGGRAGSWFRWAWTTPADLQRTAARLGLGVDDVFAAQDRWFAQLRIEGVGPAPESPYGC